MFQTGSHVNDADRLSEDTHLKFSSTNPFVLITVAISPERHRMAD